MELLQLRERRKTPARRRSRGERRADQASVVATAATSAGLESESESKSKLNHINLFEGLRLLIQLVSEWRSKEMKMMKKETAPRMVTPEDEKYRLGYGIAGKGVKLPWYLSRPNDDVNAEVDGDDDDHHHHHTSRVVEEGATSSGKKTLEEPRKERLKREKRDEERERSVFKARGFSRR